MKGKETRSSTEITLNLQYITRNYQCLLHMPFPQILWETILDNYLISILQYIFSHVLKSSSSLGLQMKLQSNLDELHMQ